MEKWIVRVKRVSAVLLFAAMFMPLARCVRPPDTQGAQPGSAQQAAPQARTRVGEKPEPVITYTYAWTDFRPAEPYAYLLFLSFLWPIPVLLYEAFGRRNWAIKTLLWLQPLLCPCAAFVIDLKSLLEQRWVGTYVALLSLALYFLAAAGAVVLEIRRLVALRRSRRAP
jgi:hypothetical protein